MGLTLEDLSEPAPDPGPADWNDQGVIVLRGVLDPVMVADYMAEWRDANGWQTLTPAFAGDDGIDPLCRLVADLPGGWDDCTPYMRHPALMALCCQAPIAEALEAAIGEPAGVHLNLTGMVSTQRNWHQDGYLNPPEVGDHYAAVWMALDNIHHQAGPFQYIPGSHRWHRLLREKIGQFVDLNDPAWPKASEDILTPLVEAVLDGQQQLTVEPGHPLPLIPEVRTYLPDAGDVLLWHPRLYHRGSEPLVRDAFRPALIAHYSGINHRGDMPTPEQHPLGGWYYPIASSGPVR
jgi:ectoine hydroxylase-related dioxygenase (phytanoyl-CoA dioxygenase family)